MTDTRDGRRLGPARRSLIYSAGASVLLVAIAGYAIFASARSSLLDEQIARLEAEARIAALTIPESPADRESWARQVAEESGARITLIDVDGVVLADSHTDPAVMENHLHRAEIQQALAGEIGYATRRSLSTGYDQHYVALPPRDGLIVRASVSQRAVEESLAPVRTAVVIAAVILGFLVLWMAILLARRMDRPILELTHDTLALAADPAADPPRSPVEDLSELAAAIRSLADNRAALLSEAGNANEVLQMVLGALTQGTILISPEDHIEYSNPAAERLLGPPGVELATLSPLPLQAAVRESRDDDSPVSVDVDHGRPVRRLSGTAIPFADQGRVLLLITDITDRERAASIRRDFVADASHELKTPLASIIASADALRIAASNDPSAVTRFADQIETSSRQLNELVSDLLDLSRLEREDPEMSPVALDEVVREVVEGIRPSAAKQDIDIDLAVEPTRVWGNSKDLSVAVRNILDNALRHTAREGSIKVVVNATGGTAVVAISDTGEGIPTRDLERIFERFYRVDAARSRATGGTGLGLAIVKHAAEGHGGRIEVESQLGVGSTFRLILPLAPEATIRSN